MDVLVHWMALLSKCSAHTKEMSPILAILTVEKDAMLSMFRPFVTKTNVFFW